MRRGARGARREGLRRGGEVRGDEQEARGARREGLKVARCTLKVGRQRGGLQRCCACTGVYARAGGLRPTLRVWGEERGGVGAPRSYARTGSGGQWCSQG
jgi:hypothetical protein